MYSTQPSWNDNMPATIVSSAAADIMDNSLGGAFGDLPSTASAAGADDRPTFFGSFEAEFWRSFADEQHQLFDAPPQPFDGSESGLWSGHFVPPPPRPPFMDGDATVHTDGLTTCDLCSWAVQEKSAFSLEGSFEAAGELGWAFSIGLVSVVSALIGAIIMITLVRCKRLKSNSNAHMNAHHHHHHHHPNRGDGRHHLHNHHHHHHDHLDHERIGFGLNNGGGGDNGDAAALHGVDINGGGGLLPWWCRKPNDPHANEHHTMPPKQRPAETLPPSASNPQVWIWLKTVNTPPTPEPMPMFPPQASIENYYTNTDEGCMMGGGSASCKVTEVVYEEIAGIG